MKYTAYNQPAQARKCNAEISIEQDLADQTQLLNRHSNLGPSRLLRDVQAVMMQFPLRNNDSFLTQCCISNPTVESQQNNDYELFEHHVHGATVSRVRETAAVFLEKQGPRQRTATWRAAQWQDQMEYPSMRR